MVGIKIKDRRKEVGINQTTLALIVGVDIRTISNWERGVSYPSIPALIRISETLDISINDLLEDELKGGLKNETRNRPEMPMENDRYE